MKRSPLAALVFVAACASHPAPAQAPATSGAASMPPPPPVTASDPTASKSMFIAFDVAATSGKVDKVGGKDAAFKPDGVKDLVFDAEVRGSVVAFVIVSVNATREPDGAFSADTFVGTQSPPSEASVEMKQGKATGGVVVYENDKLANAKDGSLTPLGAGTHRLVLHVSSKDAPKGPYRAYAIFEDKSVVASP